jgi:enoyl-CoA hydratase/carnithine racemase
MQLHGIVVVGEGAGIGQVEAQLAASTLLGGVQRLVSKIGAARAKEMVFSADGKLAGVEAVVDKDATSALLARQANTDSWYC